MFTKENCLGGPSGHRILNYNHKFCEAARRPSPEAAPLQTSQPLDLSDAHFWLSKIPHGRAHHYNITKGTKAPASPHSWTKCHISSTFLLECLVSISNLAFPKPHWSSSQTFSSSSLSSSLSNHSSLLVVQLSKLKWGVGIPHTQCTDPLASSRHFTYRLWGNWPHPLSTGDWIKRFHLIWHKRVLVGVSAPHPFLCGSDTSTYEDKHSRPHRTGR